VSRTVRCVVRLPYTHSSSSSFSSRTLSPRFSSLSTTAPHRYLHSFPTRRSSDLQYRECPAIWSWRGSERCQSSTCLQAHFAGSRSEEHTSELQSRENLVCRLLLEKKKNEHSVRRTQD